MGFLEDQAGVVFEFDDELVRRLIEKSLILEVEGLRVEIKSGVEVDVVT